MTRYAFIVHLRDINDLIYALPLPRFIATALSPILKPLALWIFPRLTGRFGFSVRSKFRIGNEITGYILLILLTGEQITSANHARQRILDAVLYAQNCLKCDIIGLGALIPSVTREGQWLADQKEVTAAIAHGDSYAVTVATEAIQKIAHLASIELSQATVALIGATGLIGDGLLTQLAPLVKNDGKLILVARTLLALETAQAKAEMLGVHNTQISSDIKAIREADIVIVATSSTQNLIEARHLKQGAIVYDLTEPRNVPQLILIERPDVTIVDGGFVLVPSFIKFLWGCHNPGVTFACMAEITMQAMAKDFRRHIGKIDPSYVAEVRRRAKEYGFRHAPFTSFHKVIPEERFTQMATERTAEQTESASSTVLLGQR